MARRRCRASRSWPSSRAWGAGGELIDSRVNDTSGLRDRPTGVTSVPPRMHRPVLALILVAGFALRVWNNDYGLPFVYSIDEGTHFTSRAVEMFWQDLDPGYYQNPAAYTYLVYAVLRVLYGPLGLRCSTCRTANVTEQFDKDPTEIWIVARTLAAAAGMAGVAATYWAARRLWGVREGLVAAAVLTFAFLAGGLLARGRDRRGRADGRGARAAVRRARRRAGPHARLRARRRGRRAGDRVQVHRRAGPAAAGDRRARAAARRRPRARWRAGAGGGAAALVFVALNPYLFGSLDAWWTDLRDQAEVAANDPKPGQESGGLSYYLDSLTWGLGWAGPPRRWRGRRAGAARRAGARPDAGGAAARAVRLPEPCNRATSALAAARLPRAGAAGAVAVARPARPSWCRGAGRPRRRPAAARSPRSCSPSRWPRTCARRGVLGREDTRSQARDSGSSAIPAGLRVSIEPAVPGRYYRSNPEGRLPPGCRAAPRAGRLDRAGLVLRRRGRPARLRPVQARPVRATRRRGAGVRLPPVLAPGRDRRLPPLRLLPRDDGERVRDRALETGDPGARAYYERLDRESSVVREFSPYDDGRGARCRSASTSPTTTTRRRTSGRARPCASTGCATAARPTARPWCGSRRRASRRRSS